MNRTFFCLEIVKSPIPHHTVYYDFLFKTEQNTYKHVIFPVFNINGNNDNNVITLLHKTI